MSEIIDESQLLFDPLLARFDAMAADLAAYAEDREIDMSRQVLDIYVRAIDTMNENPDVFVDLLDRIDMEWIESLPTPALQERAKVYQKHREVFDDLFLQHIDTSLLK